MREAAINASLNHPHVVASYSWDMRPLQPPAAAAGSAASRGIRDWHLYIVQVGGTLRAVR